MTDCSARSMFWTTTDIRVHPPSQFIDRAREDRLKAFRVGRLAPAGLAARIAHEMVAAILRDVLVVVPEVLLTFHALDGCPFLLPDGRDVEEDVRLPFHLFGLVRL